MTTQSLPARASGLGRSVNDALVITWRNLKRIPRIPELAIFAILQSIMFVLLFAFVFGGAIPLPGFESDPGAYREFLLPGIFAQTVAFAAATTRSASPMTSTRDSSTASDRCRWRDQPFSLVASWPMSCITPASWLS